MTVPTLTAYLEALEQTAHAASVAEEDYRREAARRFRELEQGRAFAFRRLNLMRSVVAAVDGAKDEAEATAKGSEAFLRELDWTGATESQRQAAERFLPVVLSAWQASQADSDQQAAEAVGRELAAFERWFAESRNAAFLSMLEREVVELPLVEV